MHRFDLRQLSLDQACLVCGVLTLKTNSLLQAKSCNLVVTIISGILNLNPEMMNNLKLCISWHSENL
jgi:hypothetical protein